MQNEITIYECTEIAEQERGHMRRLCRQRAEL